MKPSSCAGRHGTQHLRSEIVHSHMTSSTSGALVQLARETVLDLSDAAASAAGVASLRDAGHAGGAALYSAFSERLRDDGHADPAEMSLEEFSSHATSFFEKAGWGKVALRSLHDALAAIDIEQCWEAASPSGGRGCHVTIGALAGFLTPLADYPLAVMEVECGSEGGVCRFLAGNAEMLDDVYQRLVKGEGWETIGAGDL